MQSASEPMVVCPYDKSHMILKSRLQFHLIKCRAQHPNTDTVICPFNRTHIIPAKDLKVHTDTCENRIVLDKFVYQVGHPEDDMAIEKYPPPTIKMPHLTECWDEYKPGPEGSIVERMKKSAEIKHFVQPKVGGTKSEKKRHRENERLRLASLAREAEK